ncbi:MAG: hypothetical protein ACNA8W_11265, partial [Bradymonadaceae bacterium]
MNPVFRGHTLGWTLVLLVTLGSLFLAGWRLSGLPELGVSLGPDLTVRSVRVERMPGSDAHQFQRGDRLVAIQRQAVDDLRDVRAVLPHFPAHGEPLVTEDGNGTVDAEPTQAFLIDYQIVRPLHRFTLALQGEILDPMDSPAGYEPTTDRLVEIDGRLLPNGMGPEAMRSVVASRPDALLGFERANAVFSGQIKVFSPQLPLGVLLAFGLAFLIVALVWRYHGD